MEENQPLSEIYLEAAEDWADKEAAAQLLEDTKSAVMAQKQTALGGDLPVNRAEQIVKASPDWVSHLEKIVEARKVANLAKVKLEYIRMRHMEWINHESNNRAGSRL
jgi:hypothetical protein